jgi:proton glutamate symport protein
VITRQPLTGNFAMLSRLRKLSLTQWILISMLLGTLFGWAFPDVHWTGRVAALGQTPEQHPEMIVQLETDRVMTLVQAAQGKASTGEWLLGQEKTRVASETEPARKELKVGDVIRIDSDRFSAKSLKPLSTIFLRMIKSLITPLIFATLVIGIAGHGDDMKRVGRLALKSLIYFEVVTTLALFIGLAAVNLTRPGEGVGLRAPPQEGQQLAAKTQTLDDFLKHIVPESIFDAAVMFKFTGLVMKYAPIGIGAAIAVTVGHSGLDILWNLGKLILTLYAALVVFLLVVLLPAALLARVPMKKFGRAVKEPALIAFSTTSSEAALPKAMLAMQSIGVPKRIVAFVMPTGYSFNLDGTTLYLAVASIFAAQAAGIDLSWRQQLIMMLTLMLTSKGVAAVPRASLVILAGTLASFDLPLEAVAVILGVDELMDMARTTVNLIGNCLATCIMARWEGEFDDTAGGG